MYINMKILVILLLFAISVAAGGQETINGRKPTILISNSQRPLSISNSKIDGDFKNQVIKNSVNRNTSTGKSLGAKHDSAVLTNRIKYIPGPNEVEVIRYPVIVTRLLNGFCKLWKELENNKVMKKAVKYIFGMAYGWFTDHFGGNTLNNVIAEALADFRNYFDERCKDPEPTEMKEMNPAPSEWKDISPAPIEWKNQAPIEWKNTAPIEWKDMNPAPTEWKNPAPTEWKNPAPTEWKNPALIKWKETDGGGGYNSNSKFKMAADVNVTPYPYDNYHPNLFIPDEQAQQGQGHYFEHEHDWRVVSNELGQGQGKESHTHDSAVDQNSQYNNTEPWAQVQDQTQGHDWNISNELTSRGHKRMARVDGNQIGSRYNKTAASLTI